MSINALNAYCSKCLSNGNAWYLVSLFLYHKVDEWCCAVTVTTCVMLDDSKHPTMPLNSCNWIRLSSRRLKERILLPTKFKFLAPWDTRPLCVSQGVTIGRLIRWHVPSNALIQVPMPHIGLLFGLLFLFSYQRFYVQCFAIAADDFDLIIGFQHCHQQSFSFQVSVFYLVVFIVVQYSTLIFRFLWVWAFWFWRLHLLFLVLNVLGGLLLCVCPCLA